MKPEPIHHPDSDDPKPTDRLLAALWTEVLELTSPPRTSDNFFSLGGDSMAAVTLEYRIEEELSIHLTPGTLFGAPTLGELSRVVDCLMMLVDDSQDSPPSAPEIPVGKSDGSIVTP